jgi:hypothetical protein
VRICGSPCTAPRLTQLRGPSRSGRARPTISGRAIPAGAIEGPDGDSFRADIAEVGHTRLKRGRHEARRRMVDTRVRAAKDRPRVTVERSRAGPRARPELVSRRGSVSRHHPRRHHHRTAPARRRPGHRHHLPAAHCRPAAAGPPAGYRTPSPGVTGVPHTAATRAPPRPARALHHSERNPLDPRHPTRTDTAAANRQRARRLARLPARTTLGRHPARRRMPGRGYL